MEHEPVISHHVAQVEFLQLHYVRAGQGEPLVLLHGFSETWYAWRYIIPLLASAYTVIAPDLRGFGDSSKPATGYEKQTMANDIHALVRQLGFEQIDLVGHDWGGPIAYALAATHRSFVRRLAIVESIVNSGDSERDTTLRNPLWFPLFSAVPELPEALVTGRERIYLTWFYDHFAVQRQAIREQDIDEYVRAYQLPGALSAGFNLYRALPEDLKTNRELARNLLSIPVLAVAGAQGMGMGTERALKVLAEHVEGHIIEECGHYIPEEQPQKLANALLAFFSKE
jgi:pimeloyl-ACP methyl ester carboxylesterase